MIHNAIDSTTWSRKQHKMTKQQCRISGGLSLLSTMPLLLSVLAILIFMAQHIAQQSSSGAENAFVDTQNKLAINSTTTLKSVPPADKNVTGGIVNEVAHDELPIKNTTVDDESQLVTARSQPEYSYNAQMIVKTGSSMTEQPLRLLIITKQGSASLYSIADAKNIRMQRNTDCCSRCALIVPILVQALYGVLRNDDDTADSPPFYQVLLSDADFTYNRCFSITAADVAKDEICSNARNFTPVLQFGSVLTDNSILPSVVAFPTPPYIKCLMEYRLNTSLPHCESWVLPFSNKTFGELEPILFWRGKPFPFLATVATVHYTNYTSLPANEVAQRFSPRLKANRMSDACNKTWLDALSVKRHTMRPYEMSRYRYQLDLGGAGGTTWTGTLEKLAMPGVLFHHVTPAMDWFYPQLRAWEHYIPVRTDLEDLRERFEWAEAHPVEAERIAKAATEFARQFVSGAQLQSQYKEYYEKKVKELVEQYKNNTSSEERTLTVDSLLQFYQEQNVSIHSLGTCSRNECDLRLKAASLTRIPMNRLLRP